MSIEADVKRALQPSGAINLVLDSRGLFQCSIRGRSLTAWTIGVDEDPFEAIAKAAAQISDNDLPGDDIFAAASARRAALVEREAQPYVKSVTTIHFSAPDHDAIARKAVEGNFEDLLG